MNFKLLILFFIKNVKRFTHPILFLNFTFRFFVRYEEWSFETRQPAPSMLKME
jgi:hypothetical protein